MYKTTIIRFLLLGMIFCTSKISHSQPPGGPSIISPQVQADKKITFRYPAPSAKQVLLGGSQFGAAQDFLYKSTVEFIDYLKAKKVNHKSLITEGGHTWMNVKNYVNQTAQLLFK